MENLDLVGLNVLYSGIVVGIFYEFEKMDLFEILFELEWCYVMIFYS